MNDSERQHLTQAVERLKAINAKVQDLKWEAKEIADACWDKAGVKSAVVRQLAKEAAWDAVQREERRQHEESLDACRAALGLLADLPLGQAAQRAPAADHQGEKRGRGRPKGSKSKPKLATRDGAEVAPPLVDPPVPEIPDVPEAAAPAAA